MDICCFCLPSIHSPFFWKQHFNFPLKNDTLPNIYSLCVMFIQGALFSGHRVDTWTQWASRPFFWASESFINDIWAGKCWQGYISTIEPWRDSPLTPKFWYSELPHYCLFRGLIPQFVLYLDFFFLISLSQLDLVSISYNQTLTDIHAK